MRFYLLLTVAELLKRQFDLSRSLYSVIVFGQDAQLTKAKCVELGPRTAFERHFAPPTRWTDNIDKGGRLRLMEKRVDSTPVSELLLLPPPPSPRCHIR